MPDLAPTASDDAPELLLQPPRLPLACLVRRARHDAERCPVLLLIHGAGGDERALLPLARALPEGLNLVLPRAPRRMPRGGFMWYPVRFTLDGPQVRAAQVDSACAQLAALLRRLPEVLGFAPPRLYLAGFSQGGALAAMLALQRPAALAGLALFGARLLPQLLEGRRRARVPARRGERRQPRLENLPVFVAHGTLDEVLPLHHAALAMRALLRERARPTLRLHPAHHELTVAMAADFAQWLAPRAGPLGGLSPRRTPSCGGDAA